jgi:hypothetical protein
MVHLPNQADARALTGGCACGAIRFSALRLRRSGLCHCMTCRKAHASAFNPFLVFDLKDVQIEGPLQSWESSPGYDRRFCPICGSRVMAVSQGEAEISLGSLDQPGLLSPDYEAWTTRREPWLAPHPIPQYAADKTGAP